jgi:hypothetical protein
MAGYSVPGSTAAGRPVSGRSIAPDSAYGLSIMTIVLADLGRTVLAFPTRCFVWLDEQATSSA